MRWQATFDRLDQVSRTRALSDTESALLEKAIGEIDAISVKPSRAGVWSPQEEAMLRQHVADGCSIREAGRRVGRSANAAIGKWRRMGW